MDAAKKKMLVPVVGVVVAGIGLVVFAMVSVFGGGKSGNTDGGESVAVSVPDGDAVPMSESKSAAYSSRMRSISIDEYFGELPPQEDEISLVSDTTASLGAGSGAHAAAALPQSGGDAASRVFGPAPDDTPAAPSSRRSGSGSRSGSSGSRPVSQMSADERLEYDRRRAEMVVSVVGGGDAGTAAGAAVGVGAGSGSGASNGTGAPSGAQTSAPQEAEPLDFSFSSSSESIISSLDDDNSDMNIRYTEDSKRPYRCMFVRSGKIKSGQRVTIRLMEEYNSGGIRIPANTHLQAICKINERLTLTVRSLEMNGRIIPLSLEAYDTDGLPGIYCPESSKAAKTVTNDAISAAGSTFGGLVGDLANTVIRTGATIARSASGEVSVSLSSGYEFYLVKSEKK